MYIKFSLGKDNTFSLDKEPEVTRNKGKSLLELPSSYIVIDIETTGLNSKYDEIIEIGALKVRDDKVIDKFESLVFNDNIDSFITDLTGITTEMTEKAPPLKSVLSEFIKFVQDETLIAHNANFDINFIYDSVESCFGKEFNNDFIDTLRIARRAFHEFKSHRLKYLARDLNFKNTPGHRSLSDCFTTLELYLKCKEKIFSEDIKLAVYNQLKASEITCSDNSEFNPDSPLFNRTCVFTGTLEKMARKEAMQAVVDIGGLVGNSITKKTNYLILGTQDYRRLNGNSESSKTQKAKSLIEKGQDLRIISENEFYEILFGITVHED